MEHHVLDRFRHADLRGDGDDDRHDTADHEYNLPTIFRHERRGYKTWDSAADWHAADGDNSKRGTQLTRRRFSVDRDNVRNNTPDPKACQQAEPEHLIEVGRVCRDEREDAK